jgi:WD40 repeat protein
MNLSENNQLPIYSVDCASSKAGHGCFACTGSDSCIRIYRETRSSLTDPPSFVLDACATQTHHSDVNCIRWHPMDGTKLVSCGDDGLIRLWRYECT